MTVRRAVIDISHWNPVTSFAQVKAAGVVGVIAKATQGSSIKDTSYLRNCAPAYRAGLLWGAYHFADNSNVQSQVNNFLGVVGVDNDTLYALDWEDEPNGNTMTAAQAQRWIELVEAKIGVGRVVIYSGNTAKEALGAAKNEFFGSRRLWLAQYGTIPSVQPSWSKYWLWQYSDGKNGPTPHGCPGVSGLVDTSTYDGPDATLTAEWTGVVPGAVTPPTTAPPATITIITSGDVQVMVNGQLIQTGGRAG
jgi:GH25 family lysozyme M1 (1,4-beta-N-acetylmuramidase)